MLDRESTFAQPEIVELLKTKFVPVAIDQAYQRRQRDAEGEFYRTIASQSPRNNFRATTQGFYAATASGELLFYNNNRDPQKVLRLMKQALRDSASRQEPQSETLPRDAPPSDAPSPDTIADSRYNPTPPEGGLVVRVRAKVMGGYEPTNDRWKSIFHNAISRDNLWVTRAEHEALADGQFPTSLSRRMARFHLVDNTRGEPPMWKRTEIRSVDIELVDGAVRGSVHLETEQGDRGYQAELYGHIVVEDGKVTRFDVVASGDFWGEGRFTRNAPKGRFPLAIAFSLSDGSDVADAIPPQASRGWVEGYFK